MHVVVLFVWFSVLVFYLPACGDQLENNLVSIFVILQGCCILCGLLFFFVLPFLMLILLFQVCIKLL